MLCDRGDRCFTGFFGSLESFPYISILKTRVIRRQLRSLMSITKYVYSTSTNPDASLYIVVLRNLRTAFRSFGTATFTPIGVARSAM
ncbi:hypothetical protein D9M70_635700 [compost metagenome]